MKDIHVKINKNGTVDFENGYAGLNKENLQGNIYFEFEEFVEGQARAEIVINNQSGYILLDQTNQTYYLPIKSSLLAGEDILMQLVIDQEATYHKTTDTEIDNKKTYYVKVGDQYQVVEHPQKQDLENYYEAEIPVWKSETFLFDVGYSINATTTIPDDYPSWIETINELITQTNEAITQAENVNITATQTEDGADITITNKDGQPTTVEIKNGEKGEQGEPGEQGEQGEPGQPGKDGVIQYTAGTNIEINDNTISAPLTNYVQFTDYPTNDGTKSGVIKLNRNLNGIYLDNGVLIPEAVNYENYLLKGNYEFISKFTLEAVITGKGLTTKSYVDGLVGDIQTLLDNLDSGSGV